MGEMADYTIGGIIDEWDAQQDEEDELEMPYRIVATAPPGEKEENVPDVSKKKEAIDIAEISRKSKRNKRKNRENGIGKEKNK
jgi:hypothetical protein